MFARLLQRWRTWWSPPLGRRGERLAARFLRKHGFRIIVHSAREAVGEIDLVAKQGADWVFVEVKTRTSPDHGEPWRAVNAAKQRRIGRAARAFLHRRRLHDVPFRFDIVSIVWPGTPGAEPAVEHFPNAFQPPENP
jgi:putative endonuclease